MPDFKDQTVLITGGSRGLGKAMSLGFAQQGATVIIAGEWWWQYNQYPFSRGYEATSF